MSALLGPPAQPAPYEQAELASQPAPAFPTYQEYRQLHAQVLYGSIGHRFRGAAVQGKCGNKPALATDIARCSGTGKPASSTSSIQP